MNEDWRNIPGLPDKYFVSSLGNVKRVDERGTYFHILSINTRGYMSVSIKNKQYRVHRLMGLAFIPNPTNMPMINHINMIQTDNRLENLEWQDNAGNLDHARKIKGSWNPKGEDHAKAKLTEEQVIEIINLMYDGVYAGTISDMYGLSETSIASIKHGKNWKHLTNRPDIAEKLKKIRAKEYVAPHGSGSSTPKLTEVQVTEIRKGLAVGMSQKHFVDKFGVHQSTISNIASGKTWKHVK